MYISETTENVRGLIEKLENYADVTKLKFLIYIVGLLNNKQINSKNEPNPDLMEDDKIKIFDLESIGLENNLCTIWLQNLISIYNNMINNMEAYENNGNVLGITYNDEEKLILSEFEKLDFYEKLDTFSEIIIKYDNETYFDSEKIIPWNLGTNGFNIAKKIKDLKINWK